MIHGINIDTNKVGLSKVDRLGIDRMPILSFLDVLFFYFGDFDPQSIITTQHRHHINITSQQIDHRKQDNPANRGWLLVYFII